MSKTNEAIKLEETEEVKTSKQLSEDELEGASGGMQLNIANLPTQGGLPQVSNMPVTGGVEGKVICC